jgi:hypothetical protein
VQRVWLQVALAAVAGLGSLAVCFGAFVAIGYLVIASIQFGWVGSSLDTPVFLLGVSAALLFAGAGLSLPPLALGARGRHAMKTTVLSSLVFGAGVFFFFASLVTVSPVPRLLSLMALVGTPAMGSLFAVQEEEGHSVTVGLGRVTVISAVAIYCASLVAYWLVPEDTSPSYFAPYVVAAISWPVLPGIVALLRSD